MNIAAIQQEGNGGEENKALLDFEKHAETVRKNRENLDLKHNQLQETERKNKANEGLKKEQLAIQRNKPLRT